MPAEIALTEFQHKPECGESMAYRLIADSGTTKTDWKISFDDGQIFDISSEGINPVFQKKEVIAEILKSKILPHIKGLPGDIFFYSAGVSASVESTNDAMNCFKEIFPNASKIEINTDCLAAARALCGSSQGIVCIMGTGSNCGFYDGEKFIDTPRGGGFILGDECGGASLGKKLLSDFIRGLLPEKIRQELISRYKLDYGAIIENVYKRPMPNRYLASFAPFMEEFRKDKHIENIIINAFDDFIKRNVLKYDVAFPINAVGSVAYYFQDLLKIAAQNNKVQIGTILKSPIEKLLEFHSNKK